MGMMSKRKGKVGEREAAAALAETFGVEARRGVQYAGGPDSPNVVGLPGCHVEVKRCESLRLYPAMDQATADAGELVPLLLHRRNRGDWLAIVRLADLPRLIAALPRAPADDHK